MNEMFFHCRASLTTAEVAAAVTLVYVNVRWQNVLRKWITHTHWCWTGCASQRRLRLKVIGVRFTAEVPAVNSSVTWPAPSAPSADQSHWLTESSSSPGSEGLVHQPQHGHREEGPLADGGGPGGLFVCSVTAGRSDRSPQLLQECFQVGRWSMVGASHLWRSNWADCWSLWSGVDAVCRDRDYFHCTC